MNTYEAARKTLSRLSEAGHEAWIVGGAVRDHLLGCPLEQIAEFDVATSARPSEIEGLFRRRVAVGKAFGVIQVAQGGHWFEVATFRTEADYRDGRHPEEVRFATAEEDVLRRDFTVNGLLWDPCSGEIVDHVGGRDDLERGLIRAIGDPEERFQEDALRLLRAVRFGVSGSFRLEDETCAAVRANAERIVAVSAERVRDELFKIATRSSSRRGDGWRTLVSTGLARLALGVDKDEGAADSDAEVMDRLRLRDLSLWLAAALRPPSGDRSSPAARRARAREVAERLRCSAEERDRLEALLGGRGRYRDLTVERAVRLRLAATRDDRHFHEDLLQAEADAPQVLELLAAERAAHGVERPPPLIDGRRRMEAGVRPGPRVGWLLRKVRVRQLGGGLDSGEEALDWLGLG